MQQLSLFEEPRQTIDELAQILCSELNALDTVWKGTFKVTEVNLEKWDNISDQEKVLEIIFKPELNGNYLIQFKGDKKSQETIRIVGEYSPIFRRILKDNDCSFCLTPWFALLFYHKFESKNVRI